MTLAVAEASIPNTPKSITALAHILYADITGHAVSRDVEHDYTFSVRFTPVSDIHHLFVNRSPTGRKLQTDHENGSELLHHTDRDLSDFAACSSNIV